MKKLLLILLKNSFFKFISILLVICSVLYVFIILWGEVIGEIQPSTNLFDGYNTRYVILPFDIAWYSMSTGDLLIMNNDYAHIVLKDTIIKNFLFGLLSLVILTSIWLLLKDKIKMFKNKIKLFFTVLLLSSIVFSFVSPPKGIMTWEKKVDDMVKSRMPELFDWDYEKRYKAWVSKEYNDTKTFFAIYKNTILSWFGQSRYLNDTYFIMPQSWRWEDVEPKDYGEYFMMILAYILPYILLLTTIILWFKCYLLTGKKSGKEVIIQSLGESSDDEFFIKERSTGKIKKITDSDWNKIVENGEQNMYEVLYN